MHIAVRFKICEVSLFNNFETVIIAHCMISFYHSYKYVVFCMGFAWLGGVMQGFPGQDPLCNKLFFRPYPKVQAIKTKYILLNMVGYLIQFTKEKKFQSCKTRAV